jgi:hypothetical protein
MSGKPVKQPATKNRPAAFGFVTQALSEQCGSKLLTYVRLQHIYDGR